MGPTTANPVRRRSPLAPSRYPGCRESGRRAGIVDAPSGRRRQGSPATRMMPATRRSGRPSAAGDPAQLAALPGVADPAVSGGEAGDRRGTGSCTASDGAPPTGPWTPQRPEGIGRRRPPAGRWSAQPTHHQFCYAMRGTFIGKLHSYGDCPRRYVIELPGPAGSGARATDGRRQPAMERALTEVVLVAATVGRRVGRAARHAGRALTRRRVPAVVAALAMTAVVGVFATGAFADDRRPPDTPGGGPVAQHVVPDWHHQGPGFDADDDGH